MTALTIAALWLLTAIVLSLLIGGAARMRDQGGPR